MQRYDCDEKLDLLLLTETWHECSDSVVLKNVTPSGYKYLEAPRLLPPDTNFQTLNIQNIQWCLLDHTAAFDTVDHDLLMLRLERQFGLRGVVLQWFRS